MFWFMCFHKVCSISFSYFPLTSNTNRQFQFFYFFSYFVDEQKFLQYLLFTERFRFCKISDFLVLKYATFNSFDA